MRVLGFVLRTFILWVLSLVVALAGMEGAHRFVIARERDQAAAAIDSRGQAREGAPSDRGMVIEAASVGAKPRLIGPTWRASIPSRRP